MQSQGLSSPYTRDYSGPQWGEGAGPGPLPKPGHMMQCAPGQEYYQRHSDSLLQGQFLKRAGHWGLPFGSTPRPGKQYSITEGSQRSGTRYLLTLPPLIGCLLCTKWFAYIKPDFYKFSREIFSQHANSQGHAVNKSPVHAGLQNSHFKWAPITEKCPKRGSPWI